MTSDEICIIEIADIPSSHYIVKLKERDFTPRGKCVKHIGWLRERRNGVRCELRGIYSQVEKTMKVKFDKVNEIIVALVYFASSSSFVKFLRFLLRRLFLVDLTLPLANVVFTLCLVRLRNSDMLHMTATTCLSSNGKYARTKQENYCSTTIFV